VQVDAERPTLVRQYSRERVDLLPGNLKRSATDRSAAITRRGEKRRAILEELRIDEIVRRLLAKVPQAARHMQADLEENFRAVLRGSLSRLDLVSRDEFDVQTKVLERTRARLEALEARVKELEP
jgi:BMFP domain-containing protein YqiC